MGFERIPKQFCHSVSETVKHDRTLTAMSLLLINRKI